MKDCKEIEDNEADGYEEIDEKEMTCGPWLRASPLPKILFEQKKDSSSGTCSKTLFSSTSTSKCDVTSSRKDDDFVVEQSNEPHQVGKMPTKEPCLRELFTSS